MRLPMHPRTIALGLTVVLVSFAISLKAMDWLAPSVTVQAPPLVQLPPLPQAPRSSTVVAQVSVALSAIRDAAERGAPKTFGGKADNPVQQILQNADIGWTASRGPIAATGAQDVLTLTTPINGTLKVTGSLSAQATGAVSNALGSLLGGNVAKQIGAVNIKNINANADIKGSVSLTARPKLGASWRIEPNLQAQVNLGDTSLSAAGVRISVPAQVKPVIDKARKSVANFKLREGQSIGCHVTLRRNAMWEFLDRLTTAALPRIRDFRGINPRGFDGQGNYSMGVSDQSIFP